MLKFFKKEHNKKHGGFNPDDTQAIFQDMPQKKSSNQFETMDLSAIDVHDSLFGDLNDFDQKQPKELVSGFGQSKGPMFGFSNLNQLPPMKSKM